MGNVQHPDTTAQWCRWLFQWWDNAPSSAAFDALCIWPCMPASNVLHLEKDGSPCWLTAQDATSDLLILGDSFSWQ